MSKNKVLMVIKLDSVVLTKIVTPKVVLEHAEHNGMEMKTSFPVLLTLNLIKKKE